MLISIRISRNLAFLGSDMPRMLFFQVINVKMPTTVGILTFMSRKISYSFELSMRKIFYNLRARSSGQRFLCDGHMAVRGAVLYTERSSC